MISRKHENVLHFDTIALLAERNDGSRDRDLLKILIKLYRPDRDGCLSLLEFAKSVDSCYKEIRRLRASIHSSYKVGPIAALLNC
jgi:hypothetical protein